MSSKSRQRGGLHMDRRKSSFPSPKAPGRWPRRRKSVIAAGLGLGIAAAVGVWAWDQLHKGPETPALASGSTGTSQADGVGSAARAKGSSQNDDGFAARVNRGTELLAQNKPAEAVQVLTEAMQMK